MQFQIPKKVVWLAGFASFAGGIILFKEVLGGSNYDGKERLEGKTVIVTGANTGIGKETAKEMANRGARVILACRDMDKCQEARRDIALDTKNKAVYCIECNLASQQSIQQFVRLFNIKESRLDILINNAGVMHCPKSQTKEGIELQLGTNHMGHFLLTNLLLDKIKESAPSRIINVSSVAHIRGEINFSDLNSDKKYDERLAYNQSKLANILFTRELSVRLAGSGVTSNAVHPGIVFTDLWRHMGIGKSWFSYFCLYPIFWLFLRSSRQGAQTTIYTALNSDLEGVSGKYFSNKAEAEVSEDALDGEAAKRLWVISEIWTNLKTMPT